MASCTFLPGHSPSFKGISHPLPVLRGNTCLHMFVFSLSISREYHTHFQSLGITICDPLSSGKYSTHGSELPVPVHSQSESVSQSPSHEKSVFVSQSVSLTVTVSLERRCSVIIHIISERERERAVNRYVIISSRIQCVRTIYY